MTLTPTPDGARVIRAIVVCACLSLCALIALAGGVWCLLGMVRSC